MAEHELEVEDRHPERVLVVAAHPDDIEFGAAGSVAKWVKGGAEVTYCLLTDGAAGSNDPDADLEALKKTRIEEQNAAAEVIGVHDVRYLGYPDGYLDANREVRKAITRIIREVKPDRVVCQDPTTVFVRDGYINHPDHRAAGEAAVYATFPSAETRPIFPELLDEGYEPHKVKDLYLTLTIQPNTVVDISETFEDKLEALAAHVSQLGDAKRAGERIGQWNREAGEPYGFQYAEVFRVLRFYNREEEHEDGAGPGAEAES